MRRKTTEKSKKRTEREDSNCLEHVTHVIEELKSNQLPNLLQIEDLQLII